MNVSLYNAPTEYRFAMAEAVTQMPSKSPNNSATFSAGSELEYYPRKRWTVADCRALVDAGRLSPGKFELIEGDVIHKMGQSRLHMFVVNRITAVLLAIFGIDSIQSQADISIGNLDEFNDPEPDVAVLVGTLRDYLDHDPDPARDVRLVVEASDTTIRGDRNIKSRIYARNGVAEYWIVDISGRRLIVHRGPTTEGYREVLTYSDAESVAPIASPDSVVRIADLLP